MKIIFSTKQILLLASLPLTKRIEYLQAATKYLTPPEKFMLNALKLLILIPAFFLLLKVNLHWQYAMWSILLFCGFPLLVKPLQYALLEKYLAQVIKDDSTS
ncbi:DUF6170 family protein [Alteromonadaceae bacterium BrNp21-10]|nr:DUF6170 family protein [Alteromonadaceae bacterium BrNp21-10]